MGFFPLSHLLCSLGIHKTGVLLSHKVLKHLNYDSSNSYDNIFKSDKYNILSVFENYSKLLYLQEDDKELDSTVRENLPMDGWQEV